jgi:hypothetical protein
MFKQRKDELRAAQKKAPIAGESPRVRKQATIRELTIYERQVFDAIQTFRRTTLQG